MANTKERDGRLKFNGRVQDCELIFKMNSIGYRLVATGDGDPLLTYHERGQRVVLDLNGARMLVFRTGENNLGPKKGRSEDVARLRAEIGEMQAVLQRAFDEGCTEDGVDGCTIDAMRPFVSEGTAHLGGEG